MFEMYAIKAFIKAQDIVLCDQTEKNPLNKMILSLTYSCDIS